MNASKQKGTAFESAVRDYLRWALNDPKIDRAVLHGTDDIGDITGVKSRRIPVVIECKSRKQPQAYEALSEAEREAKNLAKSRHLGKSPRSVMPAAVLHLPKRGIRRRESIGRQLVVLPYGWWLEWIANPSWLMGRHIEIQPHNAATVKAATYQDVDRVINHKDQFGGVRCYAMLLPGAARHRRGVVEAMSLHTFAVALNGFRMIGETRAVACRDTPVCSNDRCIVQCEEERRTQ